MLKPRAMQRHADPNPLSHPLAAVAVCVLLAAPFLFATIVPLSDVPGHMARAAVAAFAPADPVFARLWGFRWRPIPNLGADLIVELLRRPLGVTRAYWLVAAAIPPLLAAGILMVARALGRGAGATVPWALIFVYSYPFNYGFLNYTLGVALSLLCFAAWLRLDGRPRLREALTWIAVPLLLLCHAVGGSVFALLVLSREFAQARERPGWVVTLARRVRPFVLIAVILLAWRLSAHSFAGATEFSVKAKLNAIVMLLRDQDMFLDVGSALASVAVFAAGWRGGARPHPALVPALLFLVPTFLFMPSELSGSYFADMRLLPLIPILALAAQDWRGLDPKVTQGVAWCGLVLLLLRLGVTAAGFAAYDRSYRTELLALDRIRPYSRVLVLTSRGCDALTGWRQGRLSHVGDLAILYRRSWTNSQWDTDGGHLLQIRYRPSPAFYHDPSQFVWPASCIGGAPNRRTITQTLQLVPFGGIDYLWLIDTRLPEDYREPRLRLLWAHGSSALFSVAPPLARTATRR